MGGGADGGYGEIEAEVLFAFVGDASRPERIIQVGCGVSTAVMPDGGGKGGLLARDRLHRTLSQRLAARTPRQGRDPRSLDRAGPGRRPRRHRRSRGRATCCSSIRPMPCSRAAK